MRTWIFFVAVAVSLVVLGLPAEASAKRCHPTKHGVYLTALDTLGTTCRTARAVARTWFAHKRCVPAGDPGGPPRKTCHIRARGIKFRCESKTLNGTGYRETNCFTRRYRRLVAFTASP